MGHNPADKLFYVACLGVTDTGVIREKLAGIAESEFFGPISKENGIPEIVFQKADALIIGGRVPVTNEDISKFKKLKHISVMALGSDNIDVKSATEHGIFLSTTPACSIEEVADSTLSLILNLYRQTFRMAKMVSDGEVFTSSDKIKKNLKGNIGQAVAMRAKSFGFHIGFYDPIQRRGIEKAFTVTRYEKLTDLLQISDCVTLHCPLMPQTQHIINEESIKFMKPGARLINSSRGPLVDQQALSDALKSGKIRGAALDVHEKEPFDSKCGPLKDAPNLISTPHSSWYSDECDLERRETAAEEVARGLRGKMPEDLYFVVNP